MEPQEQRGTRSFQTPRPRGRRCLHCGRLTFDFAGYIHRILTQPLAEAAVFLPEPGPEGWGSVSVLSERPKRERASQEAPGLEQELKELRPSMGVSGWTVGLRAASGPQRPRSRRPILAGARRAEPGSRAQQRERWRRYRWAAPRKAPRGRAGRRGGGACARGGEAWCLRACRPVTSRRRLRR